MRRTGLGTLTFFSAALVASAAFASRPGWEKPRDGMRLPARDVIADPSMALPSVGKSFYVFTRAALTKPQIRAAKEHGLRYLGVAAGMTYVFLREEARGAPAAFLRGEKDFIGTSSVEPRDRLETDVLRAHGAQTLAHPLWVSMHPHTTAAELVALIPDAGERIRLPKTLESRLAEESLVRTEAQDGATLERLMRSPFVAAIGMVHPKKENNAASRALSKADAIIASPYRLDGTGVVVGHWDGGSVSSGHGDFQGRVTNYESRGVSSHATHTAGTILGAGVGDADARGFAPAATMIAYDFYGDATSERRAAKHEHYHEHDNHSWGSTSTDYGGYDEGARSFDQDSRDLFLIGLKAAGNEGQSNQIVDRNYGFDSLPPDSTSKNLLVVCATDDTGDLASFSSRGPTNDGRVKPDICGNGVNLYSTMPSGRYGSMSGTSMATPSLTGMVTLLAQLYKAQYGHRWAPDLLSALMLHTVEDVFHPGPDYRFGWGNADAKAAADLIMIDAASVGQRLARGAVRARETLEYEMLVAAGAPEVKVTLAWQDTGAAGTAQRRLINDVDLELVTPSGETQFPWTLNPSSPFDDAVRTRKNDLDNVEQVLVSSPAAGTWIVRVKGTNITDPDQPVQGFVLATSHDLSRAVERVSATIPMGGLTAPDADPTGIAIPFAVQDQRDVLSLRVRVEILAAARGDVRMELVHPDGAVVVIESEDGSTRRDLFAVYPDTRSYDGDVATLFGRPGNGMWTLRVADTDPQGAVVVLDAELELDLDGTVPPPPNTPPVANAGKDESVRVSDAVTLDGSLSNDPDGDPLTFAWTQSSGAQVTLAAPTTAMPSFTAPEVTGTVRLVFTLAVADGRGGATTDDVTITVVGEDPQGENHPPVVVTNGDQSVRPNVEVRLDASASTDPDGDALMFQWSQISGEDVELVDADTSIAKLTTATATAGATLLRFRVQVDDGRGGIELDEVTIRVDPEAPDVPTVLPNLGTIADGALGGGCACSTDPVSGTTSGLVWLVVFGGVLALGSAGARKR